MNQLWVADITYIRLRAEFVYLAVILDGFSRKIVGWALDATLATRLPLSALHQAIVDRHPPPGAVHHSNMAAFIDQYYNRIRLHSALGYRPPEEFERAVASRRPGGAATMQFFRPTEGFSSEELSEEIDRESRKPPVC